MGRAACQSPPNLPPKPSNKTREGGKSTACRGLGERRPKKLDPPAGALGKWRLKNLEFLQETGGGRTAGNTLHPRSQPILGLPSGHEIGVICGMYAFTLLACGGASEDPGFAAT